MTPEDRQYFAAMLYWYACMFGLVSCGLAVSVVAMALTLWRTRASASPAGVGKGERKP